MNLTSVEQQVFSLVAKITGHGVADLEPDLFLESDLGIDSIKMVELLNGLIQLIPEAQQAAFLQSVPMEQLMQLQTLAEILQIAKNWLIPPNQTGKTTRSITLTEAEVIPIPQEKNGKTSRSMTLTETEIISIPQEKNGKTSRSMTLTETEIISIPRESKSQENNTNVEQQVFSLVAKITGHGLADLEPDLFLESDLGIDSIKMVELLNGLIQLIPEAQQAAFLQAVPMEQLMQLQTLAEILQIARQWLVSTVRETAVAIAQKPQQVKQTVETVEILDVQTYHLLTHWMLNSNSLASSVRLQGDFALKIAWQSWQDLIARHPMLRAYFVIPENATSFKDYQLAVLENPALPEIPVTDLRHLDQATQEQLVNEEFQRLLNWHWQLTEWPLHRFSVFRLEDTVYQLFLAHEHLIADGLSSQILWREFLEIYRSRNCGETPILPPPTPLESYQKLIRQLNSWHNLEEEQALTVYLKEQGKDSYLWNPANSQITSPVPLFHHQSYRLETETTAQLIARTQAWRLPLNSLLLGAFLRAAAKFESSSQPIILQIPTSGRVYPHVDVADVVGDFAQNLALSFAPVQPDEEWQHLLERVRREVERGLTLGYDRAQYRQMAQGVREQLQLKDGKVPESSLSILRSTRKSNLYCPYTGHTHLKTQYGGVKLLDYRAGGINSAGTLDLLQEIFDDRLHLFISYDSQFFSASLIKSLLEEYTAQLEELASLPIESQPTTQPLVDLPKNSQIESILREVATQIRHFSITQADLDKDLEAELGLDSLEIVRLVAQLSKRIEKANRQALLSCRSLREMAAVLNGSSDIPYLAIAQQVKRTPNAIAVLDGATQLTYLELDRLSNQVARYLRSQGVQSGVLVGMMTRRSALMWVGILGILKAGGAYVPIDPTYPEERIRYMLDHAEIGILLTQSQLTEKLFSCLAPELPLHTLIFLDEGERLGKNHTLTQVDATIWSQESDRDLPCLNHPDDLMTVLYTSGSTGRPKGVMLNHRGYMNRLQWMQKAFQLTRGDRVAQKTSCCFDISIWEIFWPLMVGATACPVEKETLKDPWHLAQWMNEMQINVMHFVPSLFGEFLNALEGGSTTFPHLRWLVFSGEALPISFIQRWRDRYGDRIGLANLYGPTEASIDVTAHIIEQRPGDQGETSIPIGKPIDNVDILILDEQMQPVSPGQLGELWIGGIQLAKGYLKDAEKTAQAFRPNPFAHLQGEHLYRTGDLTKQLPDGSIEYHGRIDHQVKIRGFRIELGEIENVLNTHPAVREAAVIVLDYGDGQKRLVAGLSGTPVDAQSIKEHLGRRLPDYMIPHRLEWLPSLPKNHNGKLDRKALQALLDAESHNQSQLTPSEEFLPLGPAQRWLIRYFEPPYQWTGYTRCLYHQPLDLELVNQALNYLIERHCTLRTIFVQREGQWWQQKIRPTEPLKAIFYDGSHLDAQERDAQIRNLIEQIAQQFRIDRWPLIAVLVVKVNDSCYDINTIGHHIIGDLLSNRVLFREFWSIYGLLLCGKPDNLKDLPVSASYSDYVRLLIEEEQQGNLASHIDYWTSQFPSAKSTFQIPFDHQLGGNLETSAASEWFTLSQRESNILLNQAKQHYRCNVYSLLLAPLYRLMSEWSGRADVVLSHRSHSRNLGNNRQFFDSVGNFAVNFPVGLKLESNTQWEQTVKQIKEKFDELPMNGVTFDWIADRLPSYLYPDNHLTPVRANYFGNRDVRPSNVFEFIKEDWDRRLSPPEQKRTTLLEFFFSIADGCLELQIEYSRNFHLSATINQLGQQYMALLQELLSTVPLPTQNQQNGNGHQPKRVPSANVFSSLPLAGKVAIVTGGGRGIGQAIALKLASQGARVAVIARNAQQLEETIAQIQELGGEAIAIRADISELEQVEAAIKQVVSQWDGIDILVNNAGITGFASLVNSDPVKWRRIVEVNLFGTYYCCRTAIPYLLKQGKGKIVNLGSDSSFIGYPLFSSYAASKHAILGLTKSLSEELKQQNIQVNSVCPAFVDTDLTPKAFRDNSIPTQQIADVVSFLVSPQADSITGECLKVFGKQDMFFYGSQNMLDPFKNKSASGVRS
jgi:amino acid adenylation domain-containing protein